MTESPKTMKSAVTHWSPWYVFDVELKQCGVNNLSAITTFVPGVHRLEVVLSSEPFPPSICPSIEIGKSWSFNIVFGSCPCNIAPLLRQAHPSPPLACSPTK